MQLALDVEAEARRRACCECWKLPRANAAVAHAMIPGVWLQLGEIAARAHLSENGTSTRISENQRKYGCRYEKRKLTKSKYEYRRLT